MPLPSVETRPFSSVGRHIVTIMKRRAEDMRQSVEDWSQVDPRLFAGEPLLAMRVLTQQGIPLRRAIDLVNDRAAALFDTDPKAFSNPPPWPGVYT